MTILRVAMTARAHKESYPAHLHLPPPPYSEAPKVFLSRFFFYVFSLPGGWILSCALVDGLLHALALTKRLGKQANSARARNVKLYFTLFRYYFEVCMKILASMQGGQCSQK